MSVCFSLDSKNNACTAYSDKQASFPIESLPDEIFANIIKYLCSGPSKDPSCAIRAMQNLTQLNYDLYQKCNQLYITHLFLKALAQQHKKSEEECAVLLHTPGARCFLQSRIHQAKLHEAYGWTEKIKSLAFQLFEQERGNLGELSGLGAFSLNFDSYGTCRLQTKKGFLMYVNRAYLKLAHPFGSLTIYNIHWSYLSYSTSILSIAQTLLQLLGGNFMGRFEISENHIVPMQDSGKYFEWVVPIQTAVSSRGAPKKNRLKKGGTPNLQSLEVYIHCVSCYALRSISGKELPQPELKTAPIWPYSSIDTIVSLIKQEQKARLEGE